MPPRTMPPPLALQLAVGPSLVALLPAEIFRGIRGIPYTYAVEILPLAAGESLSRDVAIQRDSDFLVTSQTAVVTAADDQTNLGVGALAPVMVMIQDTGLRRPLLSRPAMVQATIAAQAQPAATPYYLPLPWLLDRGTTVTLRATNVFTATVVNFRQYYQGIRLYGNRAAIRAALLAFTKMAPV